MSEQNEEQKEPSLLDKAKALFTKKKVEAKPVWKAGEFGAHSPRHSRLNYQHGPMYQKVEHHKGNVGQLKGK